MESISSSPRSNQSTTTCLTKDQFKSTGKEWLKTQANKRDATIAFEMTLEAFDDITRYTKIELDFSGLELSTCPNLPSNASLVNIARTDIDRDSLPANVKVFTNTETPRVPYPNYRFIVDMCNGFNHSSDSLNDVNDSSGDVSDLESSDNVSDLEFSDNVSDLESSGDISDSERSNENHNEDMKHVLHEHYPARNLNPALESRNLTEPVRPDLRIPQGEPHSHWLDSPSSHSHGLDRPGTQQFQPSSSESADDSSSKED